MEQALVVVNMHEHLVKSLFKPFKVERKRFVDFLDSKTKRNFYKHRFWFECSKSIDESCINTKCRYNYIEMHDNELYIYLRQEIQNERKEIEERTKKHVKKDCGIGGVEK